MSHQTFPKSSKGRKRSAAEDDSKGPARKARLTATTRNLPTPEQSVSAPLSRLASLPQELFEMAITKLGPLDILNLRAAYPTLVSRIDESNVIRRALWLPTLHENGQPNLPLELKETVDACQPQCKEDLVLVLNFREPHEPNNAARPTFKFPTSLCDLHPILADASVCIDHGRTQADQINASDRREEWNWRSDADFGIHTIFLNVSPVKFLKADLEIDGRCDKGIFDDMLLFRSLAGKCALTMVALHTWESDAEMKVREAREDRERYLVLLKTVWKVRGTAWNCTMGEMVEKLRTTVPDWRGRMAVKRTA